MPPLNTANVSVRNQASWWIFSAALLAGCLLPVSAATRTVGAEGPEDGTKADVPAGHSYHGEAFNEGPRQRAYLMGGTGNVSFPVTTQNKLVQQFINQGVGQLHGFWYFEAERSFRQAAALEPDCAMAYWGMAFANKNNAKRAKGFIAEAMKRKGKVSRREQMYIEALNEYINGKGSERGKRGRRLAEAFGKIADQYPQDIEARAFQGLYLWLTRSSKPALKYEEVDAVLRRVLKVNPMHPCHHYIIHLWDYKNPAHALPSAAVCGQTAPAIAHMWHMPGHIYSRLKRYRDAVWQQEASARVDHAHMIRDHVMPDQIHNFAHNNEWLTRNLIYVGRMHDALALAKNMIELPRHPKYNTLSRRGSTYYGRLRLFQVLYEFELWDDLIALADTPYLEPTNVPAEQTKRLRYLGRAHFALGHLQEGQAILTRLEKQLQQLKEQREKQRREEAARKKAAAKKQSAGAKPAKNSTRKPAGRKSQKSPAAQRGGKRAGRANPLDARIRIIQSAVNELKGRAAIARGDFKTGRPLLRRAGGLITTDLVRVQFQSGDKGGAEKSLRSYIKSHANEVLPLAHLVYVLWKAGKKEEARQSFSQLRTVAGEADLDAPALQRLAPLAAEFGWPADWRTPAPRPKDFGTRPPLEELGPFRWHPFRAADWALKDAEGKIHRLKDYRGRPVIVIFYLGYGCLHCAEQLQAFAPKTEQFRKAGFELIAISTDTVPDLKKSHANYKEGKFPFPLVSDATLSVFKEYRCYDDFEKMTLHGTFVIDGDGYVRWQDISYDPFMDPDFVLREAQRLLKQTSTASAVKTRRSLPADTRTPGG